MRPGPGTRSRPAWPGALHRLGLEGGSAGDVGARDLADVLDTACAAAGAASERAGAAGRGRAAGRSGAAPVGSAAASMQAIHESLTGTGGLFLGR